MLKVMMEKLKIGQKLKMSKIKLSQKHQNLLKPKLIKLLK